MELAARHAAAAARAASDAAAPPRFRDAASKGALGDGALGRGALDVGALGDALGVFPAPFGDVAHAVADAGIAVAAPRELLDATFLWEQYMATGSDALLQAAILASAASADSAVIGADRRAHGGLSHAHYPAQSRLYF